MAIRKRLKQLEELTFTEWRVLLLAILLLPMIALVLKSIGFKKTQTFLSNHLPKKPKISIHEDMQLEEAESVARMVSIAANHGFYSANCLKKSLLTWWLLGRRGIATELKIGVNKETGDFNAHAWVEYRGNVLIDATDIEDRFSAFDLR